MNIPATTARKPPCSQQAPDTYHERTQFDMSKRQNVVFIMSSHGTQRHYFEHQLNRVWREGFNMNISVNYPIVNARSGRKYDELLLTHYASILPTLTTPTVIIFNLGCNNLDAPVLAVAKTQVLLTIRKIIQMHANDDHSLIFTESNLDGTIPELSSEQLLILIKESAFSSIPSYLCPCLALE